MIIVGIARSAGSFTPDGQSDPINYDSCMIYLEAGKNDFSPPQTNTEMVGKRTAIYKLRTNVFLDSLGLRHVSDALGLDVLPYYDGTGDKLRLIGFIPNVGRKSA